eukprot:g34557.t1
MTAASQEPDPGGIIPRMDRCERNVVAFSMTDQDDSFLLSCPWSQLDCASRGLGVHILHILEWRPGGARCWLGRARLGKPL